MQHIVRILSREERDETLHDRSLLIQKAAALESINKCGTLRFHFLSVLLHFYLLMFTLFIFTECVVFFPK